MIEIFVTVSPVFQQLAFTELLGRKVRSSFGANLVPLNLEQKSLCVLCRFYFSDLHETCHTQELAYKVSDFINRILKMNIFGAIYSFQMNRLL